MKINSGTPHPPTARGGRLHQQGRRTVFPRHDSKRRPRRGFSVRRMPSGAGHEAQVFAPNCPTAMVFVPSRGRLSHNIAEHNEPAHLVAGAQVLPDVALDLLGDIDPGDLQDGIDPARTRV